MLFETNIDQNSPRISLARAAQLTGYHQDYLGQLCRLGKLEAVKIGRNWFTSPQALNNLTNAPTSVDSVVSEEDVAVQVEEPVEQQTEQSTEQFVRPVIAPNITVNEVEGMPIAIRTVPTRVRHTNQVSGILTNMRIEQLQREVTQLREMLFRLMEEVKTHTSILQTRDTVSRMEDSLKHSYVSAFDFTPPLQTEAIRAFAAEQAQDQAAGRVDAIEPPLIWQAPKPERFVITHWVAATAVIVVLVALTYVIAAGSFLGSAQPITTVYHHPAAENSLQPETPAQPTVAGAESSMDSDGGNLPTDSTGELTPIMIR